jgi:SNW domain-containing protein 1
VSDHFAKLSEALLIAEQNAREEVSKRMVINKQLELQQQQAREEELRRVAQEARMKRKAIEEEVAQDETPEERLARIEREKVPLTPLKV